MMELVQRAEQAASLHHISIAKRCSNTPITNSFEWNQPFWPDFWLDWLDLALADQDVLAASWFIQNYIIY